MLKMYKGFSPSNFDEIIDLGFCTLLRGIIWRAPSPDLNEWWCPWACAFFLCVCACVSMCMYVCHTHGLASFPLLLATLQHVRGTAGVPLENDKVVTRQVSTFINTVAIFVNKYGLIWHWLGKESLWWLEMKKYSGKQSPDERKVPSTGAIFNAVWTRTWSSNSLKVRRSGCSEYGTSKGDAQELHTITKTFKKAGRWRGSGRKQRRKMKRVRD